MASRIKARGGTWPPMVTIALAAFAFQSSTASAHTGVTGIAAATMHSATGVNAILLMNPPRRFRSLPSNA